MQSKIFIFLMLITHSICAQKTEIEFLPNLPYDKYELTLENDTLTFYLSVTSHKEDLPLIVYIQGSGISSLFIAQNEIIIPTLGHMNWYSAGQENYRILIVEKPGVKYLQTEESILFHQNFSLENWSKRIVNAINYVTKHEKINKRKILVAGHSEGGVVASRIANWMKDKISNIAIMAGEGPSQLYSLYKFADDGTFFNTKEHNMPTSEERINYLKEKWNDILADPTNTEKKFWGFTYLRWSSPKNVSNRRVVRLQGKNSSISRYF